MAAKKFEKNTKEWGIFTDFWKLCQQYWEPEEGDDYWQNLINSVNDFTKKYEDEPFARVIALAYAEYLDKKFKERNKK